MMIYLIYGENIYQQDMELRNITTASSTPPEYVDIEKLTVNGLADIVRGGSLFETARLVVIRGLAGNSQLFTKFAEWAQEVSDETTILLVESKIDKRTKAYKILKDTAKIILAEPILERDSRAAEDWLLRIAQEHAVRLTSVQAGQMVQRALLTGDRPGVRTVDQMQLLNAVIALSGSGEVTGETIATVLPPATTETVFDLLTIATNREVENLNVVLCELALVEDGHRVLALTLGQWSQLAMIASMTGSPSDFAASLGMHPYAAKKLYDLSGHFSKHDIRVLTQLASNLDAGTKLSHLTPWDAVYRLLYAIASRK